LWDVKETDYLKFYIFQIVWKRFMYFYSIKMHINLFLF
jgi:hypothetical protein